MSDIEDGELLSSDEEECIKKETLKNKLNHNSNNKVEITDSKLWDYEQNNVKVDTNNKVSESKEDNKKSKRFISTGRKKDCDRKRVCKSRDRDDNKRRRPSVDSITNSINSTHNNSDQKDVSQPKRRILCKYYAAGDCKNGKSCAFMHEEFPCKFFHDGTNNCRAGNNCKYSHEILSEEMKIVLEGFVHEGKDKAAHISPINVYNNESFIIKPPPQARPTCLLPTPNITNQPQVSSYDPDFTESYNDITNYPDKVYDEPLHHYEPIPNYPIANQSKFEINFPKPGSEEFIRSRQNLPPRNLQHFPPSLPPFNRNSYQRPLHNLDNSDENYNYYNSTNNYYNDSNNDFDHRFVSNDENIIPNGFDEGIVQNCVNKPLNYKIHAPARFIVNSQPTVKAEPIVEVAPDRETVFKDAILKLAEQIVSDPQRRSPIVEVPVKSEPSVKVATELRLPDIDMSGILKNVMKTEYTDTVINDDNELSDSDKMYIEQMKSLINLDAQFENVVPWKLQKLDTTTKQPYILYIIKLNEIHDNPLADPRLAGHPVLNFAMKTELSSPTSSDDEDNSPLSIANNDQHNFDESKAKKSYLTNGPFIKRKIV